MLRIGFASHTAVESGAELAMVKTLAHVDQDFWPIALLGETGPVQSTLERNGIEVHVFPALAGSLRGQSLSATLARGGDIARSLGQTMRLLSGLKLDGVVCNSLRAGLIVGPAARALGLPVVWHIRDMYTRDYLPFHLLALARLGCRCIPTAAIANSQATLDAARLRPSTRSMVAYSPIAYLPRDTAPGKRLRLTHVGRIAPWKGQDLFLQAFAQTFPKGDAVAQIVGAPLFGEQSYFNYLHDLVEELDISDQVSFLGHRRDVPRILACDTDILVHSSIIAEPFGQVVAQGLATGLPVIASEGGGPSELIDDHRNGLLVKRRDSDALASAMRLLRDDPHLRDALAREATKQRTLIGDSRKASRRILSFVEDVICKT